MRNTQRNSIEILWPKSLLHLVVNKKMIVSLTIVNPSHCEVYLVILREFFSLFRGFNLRGD